MKKNDLRLARKEQRARENKADILRAAEKVFTHKGFVAATMDDIASEAQFSKATLYKHFSSKKDLILAILSHSFAEVSENIGLISREDKKAKLKLWDLINFICGYYHRKKNIFRLIFFEKLTSSRSLGLNAEDQNLFSSSHPPIPDAIAVEMREISNAISGIIREGVESGEFRDMDSDDALHVFGALVRGFHIRGPMQGKEYGLEESVQLLYDFFLSGIRKSGDPAGIPEEESKKE